MELEQALEERECEVNFSALVNPNQIAPPLIFNLKAFVRDVARKKIKYKHRRKKN